MSARPRLLFVSPRFLFPVDSGGKIRTTQILRGLKGGRFEIVLASPAPPDASSRFADELSAVADRCRFWPASARGRLHALTRLRHIAGRLPVPVATDRSAAGRAAVADELATRPAVVVFDFPHAAVLAPEELQTPSVLFTHNVETEIFRRHADVEANPIKAAIWRDQTRKMAAFERASLQRFDAVIAVAERDRLAFFRDFGVRDASVIPTGVDLDYFQYHRPADAPAVVFTGSMDWLANIDGIEFMLEDVWPRVVDRVPDATMTVVGRDPPQQLIERSRAAGLRWRFTGFVDDVRPYVRAAAAYVIPLRVGGGTRLKVFEAMAMGCPVASTSIGVEGLPLEPEAHFLEADTAEDLAASIVRLLGDSELRVRLSERARAYVSANFSFEHAARVFERVCADAAGLVSSNPHDRQP